jgi:hypothetical protein
MNLQTFYANKRATLEKLRPQFPSGCCIMRSLANGAAPGGMSECTLDAAALLITESTHRLATPEEAREFYARRNAETARCAPNSLTRVRALFDSAMSTKGTSNAQ